MRRIGSGFEPNRDTKDPQDANICIDNISLMSKLESQYEFIDLDPKIVWGLLLSGAFGWGSDWGDGDGLGGAGGAGCFSKIETNKRSFKYETDRIGSFALYWPK